jgi:phenylacetate-coenzyme A ligase PaaK-like adenylate-forming protein
LSKHVIAFNWIRLKLYILVDFLSFRQLPILKRFESMENLSREELREFQFNALNNTYEKLFGSQLDSWVEFFELPITYKSNLPSSPANPHKKIRTHETSGSTGEPRTIWVPKESWARKDAIFMRSWRKMGWTNQPILRLISGEPKYEWYDWFRNVKPMNYKTLSNAHVDWVIKNRPFIIHGPGGAIRQLCELIIERGEEKILGEVKIHWCSESSQGHKSRLEKFVLEFHEQYGLAELPTVGATDGKGSLVLVEEQGIFEVVDENGSAVPDGQEGFIVVTDFNNYQTPILRYQCGDRGVIRACYNSKGKERVVLERIIGRSVDYYFGPEVKRPIGWWVVAPISHVAGTVISKWRCEIDIPNRLFRLYVKFRDSADFAQLEAYKEWIDENLGLPVEVIEAKEEAFDIYWKNSLVKVLQNEN